MFNNKLPPRTISAPAYLNVSGAPIVGTPGPGTLTNNVYHFGDLRAVVTVADELEFFTGIADWYLRVSGYVLSA